MHAVNSGDEHRLDPGDDKLFNLVKLLFEHGARVHYQDKVINESRELGGSERVFAVSVTSV